MPDTILTFPNLQVIRIDDFTAGIIVGTDYAPIYSSQAPLGSASKAVRCYARPGIGLCPAPSYKLYTSRSNTSTGFGYQMITIADIKIIPSQSPYPPVFPNFPVDGIAVSWVEMIQSSNTIAWSVHLYGPTSYTSNTIADTIMAGTSGPFVTTNLSLWPNLVKGFISPIPPAVTATSIVLASHNPLFTTNTTVTLTQQENAGGPVNRVLTTVTNAFALGTFTGGRWVFMTNTPIISLGISSAWNMNTGPAQFWTSDINATTNFVGQEYFFPEYAATIGAWGSISVGEFFAAMSGGGGFVVTGDMQFPSSATNLPGVQSTGSAIGEALPTPIGLLYCTDQNGVWVWNGGNTSAKISTQVPDNIFLRTAPPLPNVTGPSVSIGPNYRNGIWGPWALFANNMMFDTITNSWWQIEDPAVLNFQVWAGSAPAASQFFWGSSGLTVYPPSATGSHATTATVSIQMFNKNLPQPSYTWVSNPIPNPGGNVMLGAVEIVASNRTPTAATVTVTPTAPDGQQPYGNQTTQGVVFAIPPNTASYREAKALGWNDYNLCVRVDALNSTPSNGAPFVHELALGFEPVP
jgi:hypothetical protein